MESEIEAPTARSSLLLLNEYCLLEIFEFLNNDHSINLAQTCNWLRFVADRTFKKHSKFLLDGRLVNKGEEYVDWLFEHIGQHVTSLDFGFNGVAQPNSCKILGKISNSCKNLKKLELSYYSESLYVGDVQPAYRFDNVEQLTLYHCGDRFNKAFTTHFFESFHKLKTLNIFVSSIESNDLQKLFQNNRSIESFVYSTNDHNFNCKLLELIPNVQKLGLIDSSILNGRILELDSLLKLNRLTKLRLKGMFKNLNVFLRKLATNGIIEEMEFCVQVDDNLFDTLTSFSKLQLLVLSARPVYGKLKYLIAWPAHLKKLRLLDFELTQNDLLSMIRQLKSIESIDITKCRTTEDDITNFNDVPKLSQDIHDIIEHSNRTQRLDLVLPYSVKPADLSKKYLMESERLRILHQPQVYDQQNQLGIKIHFDGCDLLLKIGRRTV